MFVLQEAANMGQLLEAYMDTISPRFVDKACQIIDRFKCTTVY
jgi:hypothetical protein